MISRKKLSSFSLYFLAMITLLSVDGKAEIFVEFKMTNCSKMAIVVNDTFSSFIEKAGERSIEVLKRSNEKGEWGKITISYGNLEISYFQESDKIYYIKSTTPEWYISESMRVGAQISETELKEYNPLEIPGGYLLPYTFLEKGKQIKAYCMLLVTDKNIIKEIDLFIAFD